MTNELKIAIENLYQTFSKYHGTSTMDGSPVYDDLAKWNELLFVKPLRELTDDDLSKFAASAMLTWGETDDFKHFLPRIFELLATDLLFVDTFIVLGKLELAKWQEWEIEEREAVRVFLLNWWSNMTKNKSYFDKEAFIELYKLFEGINPLLYNWVITFEDNSFRNVIDLIDNYYHDLTNKSHNFREVDKGSISKLRLWLSDKQEIIEKGFFHYENIDKEFAEKVSNTLYTMERIK